jgi:hypothetical protein
MPTIGSSLDVLAAERQAAVAGRIAAGSLNDCLFFRQICLKFDLWRFSSVAVEAAPSWFACLA